MHQEFGQQSRNWTEKVLSHVDLGTSPEPQDSHSRRQSAIPQVVIKCPDIAFNNNAPYPVILMDNSNILALWSYLSTWWFLLVARTSWWHHTQRSKTTTSVFISFDKNLSFSVKSTIRKRIFWFFWNINKSQLCPSKESKTRKARTSMRVIMSRPSIAVERMRVRYV